MSAMSALERAFREKKEQMLEDATTKQQAKSRNVADPMIGVDQIEKCLANFLMTKQVACGGWWDLLLMCAK